MAVAFGGIEPKSLQHINTHFFLIGKLRMFFKCCNQLIFADVAALMIEADIPSLMVDAGADDIQLLMVCYAKRLGNLSPTILHTMTKPHSVDLTMIKAGPSVHRHRVGIVEMQ